MKKDKQLEIVKTVINKMFEIAQHNVIYEDIVELEINWYNQWTMTKEQNQRWKKWGIEYLRKKARWSKRMAEREMAMFDLMYGLKIDKK